MTTIRTFMTDDHRRCDDFFAEVEQAIDKKNVPAARAAFGHFRNAMLAHEVADDYLRVVALSLLAWAWARIVHAAPETSRWTAPAAAFRRFVLPELDMRLGMVKRACDAVLSPVTAA